MAVRESVFGSKAERKNYKKLIKTWGKSFNVHHNLPFLNVFKGRDELIDLSSYDVFKLSDTEFEKLKKPVLIL